LDKEPVNVWKRAADELQTAKNIYIIGYSLPETDVFFRYLYALGSIGSARIERFWIFNPSNDPHVFEKYRNLVGDTVETRFRYFPVSFESSANNFSFADEINSGVTYFDDFEEKVTPTEPRYY